MANMNIIPWGLHPLEKWIKTELEQRAAEVGMNTDPKMYAGPKTAWVRFFSNGRGYPEDDNGFIMGGVNGFEDSYGFNEYGQSILGYGVNGKPKFIAASGEGGSSFPHRPPPAIDNIEVSLYGGQNSSFSGLCRKARVNWKCYSLDQLEYLAPYFLSPKITCVLEWGWNNYEPASLIDLTNKQEILDIFLKGDILMEKIRTSNGNYDATVGFVFDYNFSLNPLGGYDCYTEFVNANWLVEGQEYKSVAKTSVVNGADVPVKTFEEFIGKDLENLCNPNSEITQDLMATGRTFSTKQGLGKVGTKNWLRMDLVADIFNKYFSMHFSDINGRKTEQGLMVLDIKDTVICGHPALKSTNIDVLIPNQFAPRFTTRISEERFDKNYTTSGKDLKEASIETGQYSKLFVNTGILTTIESRKLTSEYDDLKKIINDGPGGNSFPMFSPTGSSAPGMWGYLKDIFVSTQIIKDVANSNESAYRFLENLCGLINNAFSGVVQLKVLPHQQGAMMTIVDMNYNPNSTPEAVKELVRFTPGSVNSAYILAAGLNVKLSPEMSWQMVAQSSAGKMVAGVRQTNRFLGNDRLYDVGVVDGPPVSDNSSISDSGISPRDLPGEFVTYEVNKKKNILVEPDPKFMQYILSSDQSGKSIYINSPILPGTKFTIETLGIGGFTFLGQFTLDHVPKAYAYQNCVWQIADIKQVVKNGNWTTSVTADCRPLSFITSP